MSQIRVNGVSLYYEEHGAGSPILCIHGAGSSALAWGDAVSEFARRGRVIVYDRRGCTRSERPSPTRRRASPSRPKTRRRCSRRWTRNPPW